MIAANPKKMVQKVSKVISVDNFQFLCSAVYDDSGIVLDESKRYLLEARLSPVARDEGLDTIDSLCNLMRAVGGKRVRDHVVEAMTTNETLFFRDVKPFDALKQVLFPEITAESRADQTVRIWCAASSSGQEPYSIAMLWSEMKIPGWDLKIQATDLSDQMLERGRAGRYLQLEVNRGLPAMYLVRYFEREESEWVIKPEIRKMIKWDKFNLKHPMTRFGPFDLVFCRNVLIYFDQQTKSSIIQGLRKRLKPRGHLFLGASESPLGLDEKLERRPVGPAIAYRAP